MNFARRWIRENAIEIFIYCGLLFSAGLMIYAAATAAQARGSLKDPPEGYYSPPLRPQPVAVQRIPALPTPNPERQERTAPTQFTELEARRVILLKCASFYVIAHSVTADESYKQRGKAVFLAFNGLPYREGQIELGNMLFSDLYEEYTADSETASEEVRWAALRDRYEESCDLIAEPLLKEGVNHDTSEHRVD